MDAPDNPDFWTPQEIVDRWKVSTDYVVREFEDTEGALILGRPRSREARGHRVLRIPNSVLRAIETEKSIQ
jgi:hypothetical protein